MKNRTESIPKEIRQVNKQGYKAEIKNNYI